MITRQNLLEVFFDELAQSIVNDLEDNSSVNFDYKRLEDSDKEEVKLFVKGKVKEELRRDLNIRLEQHGKYYFRRAMESINNE